MSSIMGGFSIAIGFLCYMNCYNPLGAVIFSIGLYLVLWNNFFLFTGRIGYCKTKKDFLQALQILIGNAFGCSLSLIYSLPKNIIENKLNQPLYIVFIKGFICGILIHVAVDFYKKGKTLAPLLAVPAFILCGAEHCIADLCFMFAGRTFDFLFLLVVIIGNTCGSLFVNNFDFY